SGFFSRGFGPRVFGARPSSSPRSRAARHAAMRDEYNPSRRNSAPSSPGFVHASASRRILRLYSALKRRRFALAATSVSVPCPRPFSVTSILGSSHLALYDSKFSEVGCLKSRWHVGGAAHLIWLGDSMER